MSPFLDISQLGKTYDTPKGPAVIVDHFDLKIKKGEFITLIGHSGCGKSTVLAMLAETEQLARAQMRINLAYINRRRAHDIGICTKLSYGGGGELDLLLGAGGF